MNPILLLELKPNFFGPDEWFWYRGSLDSLEKAPASPHLKPNGGLVRFRDIRLRKRALAVFVDDHQVFADFGRGPRNASIGEVDVSIRKFLNVTFASVHQREGDPLTHYVVFTPPWRYLTNDGMFMDGVEPFCVVMAHLASRESRARYLQIIEASRDG